MKFKTKHISAVSLIEVMVAISIFFLGLISVYGVVSSTLRLNDYNKNFIIASQLAREQMEIVKNIRDYNFKNIIVWDSIDGNRNNWKNESYYTVENKYTGSSFLDTDIQEINNFAQGEDVLATQMQQYKLCIDDIGRYVFDCIGNKKSPFFRYLGVSEVSYINDDGEKVIISDALKFHSKVIWYQGGYHETQISFILTNWQRL